MSIERGLWRFNWIEGFEKRKMEGFVTKICFWNLHKVLLGKVEQENQEEMLSMKWFWSPDKIKMSLW